MAQRGQRRGPGDRGRNRDGGDRDAGGRGGRWRRRPRKCFFCTEGIKHIDYKEGEKLGRFLNDRGKIKPRRQTGTCARHQRKLASAIKRARHLALLPFTSGPAR